MPNVTPAQIRGARGMLDWSMLDLATASGVSVSTVKRMEAGGRQPVSDEARAVVRAALERAGVVLTEDDGWAVVKVRVGSLQSRSSDLVDEPRSSALCVTGS